MSETIKIAIITFLSGAVGAVCAVVASIITSRVASRSTIKQVVVQEYFKKRVEAFESFLTWQHKCATFPGNDDFLHKFIEAYNGAILLSSPETTAKIIMLFDATVKGRKTNGVFEDAVIAMQRDLVVYTDPKIMRNKWPKSLIKRYDLVNHRNG